MNEPKSFAEQRGREAVADEEHIPDWIYEGKNVAVILRAVLESDERCNLCKCSACQCIEARWIDV